MSRPSLEDHLQPVPSPVARAMREEAASLAPGAAAVMGRFFSILHARREPVAAPSSESFRQAAASESTFRTLLRALARYAPDVSTAAASEVKAEWVSRRPKPKRARLARGQAPRPRIDSTIWPRSWQVMERRLAKATIKASSLARYRASIHRCAQLVARGHGSETMGFMTGCALVEGFRKTELGKKPLRPATIANYLDGLIMLGKHGGAHEDSLAGLRFIVEDLRENARAGGKVKAKRLKALTEAGGFAFIADRIGEMREKADALPDHASEKWRLLQAVALCAVSMNKPGRTGDVSRWCLGDALIRESDGTWVLAWEQGKTGYDTEAGRLWPEVSEILDALILGGRPDRFVHLRYRALLGMNWLTLGPKAISVKWPSSVVKGVIGVPLHDLRALAADYMRRHDPERAADVISAHLGHRTWRAGEAYRCESEGEAAAKAWAEMRRQIAKG